VAVHVRCLILQCSAQAHSLLHTLQVTVWTPGLRNSRSWQHTRICLPPLSSSCWQHSCCRRSNCSGTCAPTFCSRWRRSQQWHCVACEDPLYSCIEEPTAGASFGTCQHTAPLQVLYNIQCYCSRSHSWTFGDQTRRHAHMRWAASSVCSHSWRGVVYTPPPLKSPGM
jgi:hypothetical protein